MLVRLTEVYEIPSENRFGMREISINPDHVGVIRQDHNAKAALNEGRMPSGLSKEIDFTRIYLNIGNLNVVVVGSQELVEQKLLNSRRVLKG